MIFTTIDRCAHTLDNNRFDGAEITEILHPPIVGECAEFALVGGNRTLTAPIIALSYF